MGIWIFSQPKRTARGFPVGCKTGSVLFLLWLLAVAAGLKAGFTYANTPGIPAQLVRWPAASEIAASGGEGQLLLFAHPFCPCTAATIAELHRVLSREPGTRVRTRIIFFQPEDASAQWKDTANWRAARQIPGAELLQDPGGRLARQFQARTSGQVFFFDQAGELRFRGGITISRGMAGANPGSASVEALLSGGAPAVSSAPVFGCSLLGGGPA